jgi:hypothetical protein
MARGGTGTARKELPPSREKEKAMRFSMLTAMTLALAMVAGEAMADCPKCDVQVSANTTSMRHLKVTRTELLWGQGINQMVIWFFPDFEPGKPGGGPALLGSDYNLTVDAPYIGMNIYSPLANLEWVSRVIYVLYIKVGDEDWARISSFNLALPNFGTLDGHYQTKGYLGDPALDPDDQLWHDRLMSEELGVKIVIEDLNEEKLLTAFEGTIPAVGE